ncbi:YbbR-like domain-containing protein [Pedobacter sandarakinus]|uniref:YbbR-like domain-containing protein n=1 Tax=Pedobacter sandarakinus TaxID=353156 RepID=UPI002246EADD|nr:YbbR-like domain-containing protein [Pedobacter sandarakinus]MCX2575435.1 YbbR-like domain-containing protein [Pedobacter sandarakinus]
MPFIRLTKIEKRRVFTLLACLFLAIAAWLFMALNNKYIYTAKTVLVFKNTPTKRAFYPLQSDTVDLQVEGTGWQLLFSRLRISPPSISVNLSQLNTKDFVTFSDQLYNVNRQLESTQKVISVKPDTLYFDFTKRTVKKVPVKLVSRLDFVSQYGISSDILLTPKSIKVAGPSEELAKITSWPTDTLILDKIQSSSTIRIGLQHSIHKNVSIYPSSVEVKLPVDEFTEKTIDVPLKIINNKNYNSIKLYPKKIKITFLVALSNYNVVNENFIDAVVDANEWVVLNHKQLTVKLTQFPYYCKLVKISPSKVDFVIEK